MVVSTAGRAGAVVAARAAAHAAIAASSAATRSRPLLYSLATLRLAACTLTRIQESASKALTAIKAMQWLPCHRRLKARCMETKTAAHHLSARVGNRVEAD